MPDAADDNFQRGDLSLLMRLVVRLDDLADTAELMGDLDGAARYRDAASRRRLAAMQLLDD